MAELNFEHLVLLVGTNPLPNLVVADYFLKEIKSIRHIWLVHSEKTSDQAGTKEQAERLEQAIKKRFKTHECLHFPLEKVAISDAGNAQSICNAVKNRMTEKMKNGSVHLNYTGGTKTMSTHVYSSLVQLFHDTFTSSYLDARTCRLASDDGNILAQDLRKKTSVDFMEMITLHGFERKNKPSNHSDLAPALKAFQKLINEDKISVFYEAYHRCIFEKKNGDLAKKPSELVNMQKINSFHPDKEFQEIIQSMSEPYRLFNANGNYRPIDNEHFEAALKFLDGMWLEYHVLDVIQKAGASSRIKVDQNWEIYKPEWKSRDLEFQIDVLLIDGYQLTGISCTTASQKSLCKGKGFEIIHRARQIGGDEAKAVLVTRLSSDKANSLEEDLMVHTGATQGNILVLGEKDWKDAYLLKKLSKFVDAF